MGFSRYRCPKCRARIDIRRLFDGRCIINCEGCRLIHVARPSEAGLDEAYVTFLEDYESGRCLSGVDLESFMEEQGLLRPLREVKGMVDALEVGFDELPEVFRKAVTSRADYLVTYRMLAEEPPQLGAEVGEARLDAALADALRALGVKRLYKFQEEAITRILDGENIVIVAPTGSGKTEAFAAPIVHLIGSRVDRFGGLRPRGGVVRALFVYPTKALARDQLPKLLKLAYSVGVTIRIFDGDVPQKERREILETPPDIILTNFDTLHHHMLHRTPFSKLLGNVNYLVVDEVHVYKGTMGANVHFIFRRLSRLCPPVQIVAASATISNPKEFCEALFSTPFTLVSGSGGRRGRIHFAMLFPTLRSHRSLAIALLKDASSAGYQTLCFSSSHLGAELTAFYAKRSGVDVEVHRAGLLPGHRRRVEEMFRRGLLKTITCTPTLELGIDVGFTNAIVSDLVNVTRLTQRTGRAGRRGQESIVFLALRDNDPISLHYMKNPDDYFADAEHGYVDPSNPAVAEYQLLAAAMDKPLRGDEFPAFQEVQNRLLLQGLLRRKGGFLLPEYRATRMILAGYDIRGSGESVAIQARGKKIGERSMPQALEELHPEAVYFLGGSRYRSVELRLGPRSTAVVERLPPNYPYYTKALLEEEPYIVKVHERRRAFNAEVAYCDLEIMKRVVGYVNREVGKDAKVGRPMPLKEPVEYRFRTKGVVFKAPRPEKVLSQQPSDRLGDVSASSFHASEHVSIEGTDMITGGAASDMGGLSMGSSGFIFIYDGAVGGNGATRLLYDRLETAFKRAYEILVHCPCTSESGCPRCTYSYRCGNNNMYLHRRGAAEVLQRIIEGQRSDLDVSLLRPGEKGLV